MTWDESKVTRDRTGRFAEHWARKLVERIDAGRRQGREGLARTGVTAVRGTMAPPRAAQLGFVRVGDHPARLGAIGGERPGHFTPSGHRQAGGVWVDPARPGTRHAPVFRDDFGSQIGALAPDLSRARIAKEAVTDRRHADRSTSPEWVAVQKRRKARARAGRAGHDVWLLTVDGQIERRRGRSGA